MYKTRIKLRFSCFSRVAMKRRIAMIAKLRNQFGLENIKSAAERKDGMIFQYWDTKDLKDHPGIKDIIYAMTGRMMGIEYA